MTAIFDGESIRPEVPVDLAPNTKVHVLLWTEDDEMEEERRFWSKLSLHGLSQAYGDDEPEYSIADAVP